MDLASKPSAKCSAETPVSAFIATNDLFRAVDASWRFRDESDETWEDYLVRAYRSRFSGATIDEVRRRVFTDPSFGSLLTFEESHSRRLGQPLVQFDTTRIKNDRFYCVNGARTGSEYEVMVIRHERDLITPTKCDSISVISHLSLNRHAIERMYEREGLRRRSELLPKIRDELVQAERHVAFAFASGLYLGTSVNQPGAATVVPFANGLLYVRNSIVAMETQHRPNSRVIASKGGFQSKRLPVNPGQTATVPERLGNMQGYVVPMATTYISEGMIHGRIEQQAYYQGFLDAAADYDLKAISTDTSFNRLFEHQRAVPATHQPVIDPHRRLHYLLSQLAKRTDPTEIWVPIGAGREHARLIRHAQPVLKAA